MVFRLEIGCDNDAFADCESAEVAKILYNLAIKIRREGISDGKLFDTNGNATGSYGFYNGSDSE